MSYQHLTHTELQEILDSARENRDSVAVNVHDFYTLVEQAKRANNLMDSLGRHHPYAKDLHGQVLISMSLYRGDDPP